MSEVPVHHGGDTGVVKTERKDRFMELMEERHRNALLMLEVEKILSTELPLDKEGVGEPNEGQKNKALIALFPMVKDWSERILLPGVSVDKPKRGISRASFFETKNYKDKLTKISDAIHRYFDEKIRAQRVEMEIQGRLEAEGKNINPEEMGRQIFMKSTGKKPVGQVSLTRQGGYLVIIFSKDADYFKFKGIKKDESEACFIRKKVVFSRELAR